MIELLTGEESSEHRAALNINEETRLLLFITEGATDPRAYAEVVRAA